MKFLRNALDKMHPLFDKGGKLEKLYPLYEAGDTFFYTPGLVDRGQEDSWLLGMGHRRRGR